MNVPKFLGGGARVAGTLLCAAALVSCTSGPQPSSAPSARATSAVAHFLGRPHLPPATWNGDSVPLGTIWRAYFPGVGLFTTDNSGTTILTAELEHPRGRAVTSLDRIALVERARSFAAAHVHDIATLAQYAEGETDVGSELLEVVTWREERGAAWLPKVVTVELQLDGSPVGFAYNPTSVGAVNVQPAVPASSAAATALQAQTSSSRLSGSPELEVVGPPPAKPRLVWNVRLEQGRSPSDAAINAYLVDAQTGRLIAPGSP